MRIVFRTILFFFLGVIALTGCGSPSFQGSLTGTNGTGTGPTPPAGQPAVTSLNPSTAMAGGASFTLTAYGSSFAPSTTLLWNNASLTTTYVSSTVLQAQVPASLIAQPGGAYVLASPMASLNFGADFTITAPPFTFDDSFSVSTVPVEANDIAWDQANQQFYLSVGSGNGTNANTITALNPQTGALGPSVSTGSEPSRLAISTDDTYLYTGLNTTDSVGRYTLPALQPDINIPMGYYAIDLVVQPGNPHSIAVSRGEEGVSPQEEGGIVIYNDAVALPQSVPGFSDNGPGSISSLVWNPNGQTLYGIDTETSGGSGLYTMSVSSAGVQFQNKTTADGLYFGNNLHFDSTTGHLYSDSGTVIDPATDAVIGTFPLNTLQGGLGGTIMVPDGSLNIAYFLGQTAWGGGAGNYVIAAYDLTHFTFLGAISITSVSGTPSRMLRWGSNGLAFLTGDSYGAGSAGDGVYLVSGDFVTSPAP